MTEFHVAMGLIYQSMRIERNRICYANLSSRIEWHASKLDEEMSDLKYHVKRVQDDLDYNNLVLLYLV